MKKSHITGVLVIICLTLSSPVQGYHITGNFTNLDSQLVPYSSYSGTLLMVEAFQTQCRYCRDEAHRNRMNRLFSMYSDQMEFLLVSVFGSDGIDDVETFVSEFGVNWDVGIDAYDALIQTFGIDGTPTTLLLNQNGESLRAWVGHKSFETYVDAINNYVDEPITLESSTTSKDGGVGGGDSQPSVIENLFSSPLFTAGILIFALIAIFFKFTGSSNQM